MTANGSSSGSPGVFVSASTPLVGLNYYDGRFLRADDLNLERKGQRAYAEFSNQAGGAGLVYGFDLSWEGDLLRLSAGLAVDPKGRVLYLPEQREVKIPDLLNAPSQSSGGAATQGTAASAAGFGPCDQAATSSAAGISVVGGSQLYLVRLSYVQRPSGQGEVLGRLCDDACVTGTDQLYAVDGVQVTLAPLTLRDLPEFPGVIRPEVHLRSQVASAFFAAEWDLGLPMLSANGLGTKVWCAGAPSASAENVVPVGVLGWNGSAVTFLDEWTARRERIEPSPRIYWAGRMELRPWPVFLAQVLQFQCHLADLGVLTAGPAAPHGGRAGVYAPAKELLDESRKLMGELATAVTRMSSAGETADEQQLKDAVQRYEDLEGRIRAAAAAPVPSVLASNHILLDSGIVELPPAGYLPVNTASGLALRRQLQQLLGEGVDLRLCAVRQDQIAHELERAQHMKRISLIQGLRSRADRELVDILVPDGVLETDTTVRTDHEFAVDVSVGPDASSNTPKTKAGGDLNRLLLQGTGRVDLGDSLTVRAAVAGSAEAALSDMAGLIAGVSGHGRSWEETLSELHTLGFGSGVPSTGPLRDVGDLVNRAVAQRMQGTPGEVVDVPEAAGQVAAISFSGWVTGDPFTMADGAYTPFHLEFDLIRPGQPTMWVTYSADGRLQRLSGRIGPTGPEVQISVTGSAQSATADDPAGTPLGFTRKMVLRGGRQDGSNLLALSDTQVTWMISVSWQGEPIEAKGTLAQKATVAGQELAAVKVVTDAFALTLGGIESLPSPAPTGARAIATFEAAETATINDPGEAHRESAIAALQMLSGLHLDDTTYVERGYSELFPSGAALPSRVRPTIDWVLFRRRRREECEGTTELALVGTSKVTAWVVRAESIDEAKSMTDTLIGAGQAKIGWKAANGDFLEFEADAATLLTTPSAWRGRYQAADGGSIIFCAGYAVAPGRSDVPVGLGRAQALLDATAPMATLDPNGQVKLVTSPPAQEMLAGTDGSIFLITYTLDKVDVITIDAVDTANQQAAELANAVRNGGKDVVDHAGPEAVPVLATVDAAWSLTPPAALDLKKKLDGRKADLKKQHNADVDSSTVVWMHQSLTGERKIQSEEHVNLVLGALGIENAQDVPRKTVDFQRDDRPPARVYVLFEPSAQPS